MSERYTPTTEEVKAAYEYRQFPTWDRNSNDIEAEFDAWLSEIKREAEPPPLRRNRRPGSRIRRQPSECCEPPRPR